MYDRLKNLLSPLFIFCLGVLILNDLVLKATFHNMITGKLSDFCGLFIFPIFWSAVFPKHKLGVFIFSAVLFIYWKSEYASGLIELINTIFAVQRPIDPTDLIALPVLLLAWFHLKGCPKIVIGNSLFARLSAFFIGTVAIFSFCATTQQRYVQGFDQPQYVLLRSAMTPVADSPYEYDFYKKDSLLVFKVNQMFISKAVRYDDFNKNRSIRELDKYVLGQFADSANLISPGIINALSVSTAAGRDSLRFNGGRLDGPFSRTKNGKLIIAGFYKMGLEDSTWTIKDSSSTKVEILTFINGERTSVTQFENDKPISVSSINTRADTIRNTYVKIGILFLFVVGTILLLVRNYRRTYPEPLKLKPVWKWLFCFISPFFVWLLHVGIRILLMDFHQDFFETLATIIFIFIATCPLMFVVVFWMKLRMEIDMLLYCLLFALVCSIWTTCCTIIALSS